MGIIVLNYPWLWKSLKNILWNYVQNILYLRLDIFYTGYLHQHLEKK